MSTSTRPDPKKTDHYGIERVSSDDPGLIDKLRAKHEWFDHIMRMQERYSDQGGNHFAAAVTYFSVLSVFPLLMLVFAILAFVLRGNAELLAQVQSYIADNLDGQMGDTINKVIENSMEQAGGVFTIGFLTALWSGLGWMGNLRMSVTALWKRPIIAENFLAGKGRDLLRLIGMIVMIGLTFAVTAVGSSGLTKTLIEAVGLGHVPGIGVFTRIAAIAIGLLANWLLFLWMLAELPRGGAPIKSAAKGAVIGAVGLEIVKQLGSMFFSNALSNPAGAVFGPIIGLMVILFLFWRITMYATAWTATTREALADEVHEAPPPAVINVRAEAAEPGGIARLLRRH
ncbi:YhjD/YihY/BrkB family envelope integrity protein [Corynebacterium sp. H113]|uniref:YhjD/YihY/BrkB family envelope integrity protein n=1 Tax=Corynebacterium sp. H113 TaxID=3133419 RepID=UPI0030A9C912